MERGIAIENVEAVFIATVANVNLINSCIYSRMKLIRNFLIEKHGCDFALFYI